jgi:hypothetical protein
MSTVLLLGFLLGEEESHPEFLRAVIASNSVGAVFERRSVTADAVREGQGIRAHRTPLVSRIA